MTRTTYELRLERVDGSTPIYEIYEVEALDHYLRFESATTNWTYYVNHSEIKEWKAREIP